MVLSVKGNRVLCPRNSQISAMLVCAKPLSEALNCLLVFLLTPLFLFPCLFFLISFHLLRMHVCCAVHEYALTSLGMDGWILVCGHTSLSVCPQILFCLIHSGRNSQTQRSLMWSVLISLLSGSTVCSYWGWNHRPFTCSPGTQIPALTLV